MRLPVVTLVIPLPRMVTPHPTPRALPWPHPPRKSARGAWHVCPQPLPQHFRPPPQSLSASQLRTHAASKPRARPGAAHSPCLCPRAACRNSQLDRHSGEGEAWEWGFM